LSAPKVPQNIQHLRLLSAFSELVFKSAVLSMEVIETDSAAELYIRDAMIDIIIREGNMSIMLNASFRSSEVKTTDGTATAVANARDMMPCFQRRPTRSRTLPPRS